MKTLVLFFFVSLHLTISSQTGRLKGIISFNNETQPFVNVIIKGTSIGTITNDLGEYTLHNIPPGKHKVIISFVGFTTLQKTIQIQKNVTTPLNVTLIEDKNSLDEIVISGTLKPVKRLDSPVPVEVYSPTFFKKNPTPSVFESLQNVNGVRPQVNCSVCNTGDIHINGLEGPYTFVLIDGMPIVSGLSTVYGLTGIPQALVERVEIVKGPASTLYGSEAVGGIINIITKKPSSAPLFSAETFTSSWGELNTDIGLKYNLGQHQSLLGVNYFNYQNTIDNNDDGFTDLTLQNRMSLFHKINFNRKNNRLFTIAARYIYEDRWGGAINWTPKNRGGSDIYAESIYTSRWETFGTYALPTSRNINFQFSANGHSQNSFYGTTSYNAEQYIGFSQLTWGTTYGDFHDILMGIAYRYTYYDDNTFATVNAQGNSPSTIHLPGIFIQDEIQLSELNTLLLGLRYDYNSIHGGIFSPRLNYKWNSSDKLDLIRISIGNGFRVANVFTEDHAALTGSRTVSFEGDLNPETSWNTSINYTKKIFTNRNTLITLDASAFYTYFDNKIIPDYESDPNKIIYANLNGYAVSKGLSLNTDVNFTNGLSLIAGATLMEVSTTENGTEERQLLTEGFSGTWSVTYKVPNTKITVDYTGNVYAPMNLPLLGDKDPRSPKSPWYSIQNIQFTQTFSNGFEVFGGVKNLLNFTPARNSILNANNPFEIGVDVDQNPELAFDPSYVYASNQGVRAFLGIRYKLF